MATRIANFKVGDKLLYTSPTSMKENNTPITEEGTCTENTKGDVTKVSFGAKGTYVSNVYLTKM